MTPILTDLELDYVSTVAGYPVDFEQAFEFIQGLEKFLMEDEQIITNNES